MLELKKAENILWDDLPKIETLFFARNTLANHLNGCGQIRGLESILGYPIMGYYSVTYKESQQHLQQLLNALDNGDIFLLRDDPFVPAVKWVEPADNPGHWQVQDSSGGWGYIPRAKLNDIIQFQVAHRQLSSNQTLIIKETQQLDKKIPVVSQKSNIICKQCADQSLNLAINYIHKEMIENIKGDEVRTMRDNLRLLQWDNLIPGKLTIDILQAYYQWYTLVKDEAAWDYKEKIRSMYGEWLCDKPSKKMYNFDIWGNMHYGYIGLAIGFPEWDLLAGAGFAQVIAKTVPKGYWKRRFDEIGDADFLAAFDDAKDQTAIQVGFTLWKQYRNHVTKNNIIDAIRIAANKLNTQPCTTL